MTKTTGLTARVVDLTPELAEELLSRNPRNRDISNRNYAYVRRAMERGEWVLNGEAIKTGEDGYILDGQHRCRAVVDTGITIRTLLVEGLPSSTQDTMDTGKSRSLSDILKIRGERSSARLAAITRRLHVLEEYGLRAACGGGTSYISTNRECLDYLDSNPWIREMVQPAFQIQTKANYPGCALTATLMVAFDRIDSDDSVYFWARAVDGVGLSAEHPVYVLRKTLNTIAEDSRGERNERYLGAITIKAWNAYRAGDPVGQLRFRVGGAKPEAFPEPK